MEGNVQQVVKQVSMFDGNEADDFLERSSKLNADAEEDVLIKMAPAYETNDEAIVPLVVNLKKNWYGLRQSSWSSPSSASARSSRIHACTSTRTRLASSS